MKLYVMFGQRKESYKGEYGPEVLLCWDEFSIDENPEGFGKACDKVRKEVKSDFSTIKVIVINIDGDKIAQILNEVPEIKGKILNNNE